MKKVALIIAAIAFLGACKDKVERRYISNVPVYTDYETFRSSGGFESARSIENQGNIYIKDDFLFMVEPDKGIHFINNSNPSSPSQTGFLNVWGATGMSIKGNYLFVNSFIDLVVYDISSKSNPVLVERLENVFPTAVPTSDKNYPHQSVDKSKGVVTSWKTEEVREEAPTSNNIWFENCPECSFALESDGAFITNSDGGSSGTGISGSITLFTIINDYLYVVENGNSMHPINISNPLELEAYDPIWVREIETLFPHQDYIFAGTPTGMIVYGTSNPTSPDYISSIRHGRGCDPVVVQDNYAYVTVRSGGPCGGDINQMDVIDISSISNPVLKKSFQFKNPHGLGIDGDLLFLCDGEDGLKVLDASNPETAGDNVMHKFKSIQATDVIPFNNVAIVIGDDGIFQYDYSDPSDLKLLSELNF